MSIHGLKPKFVDLAGYKAWRASYATVYHTVSQRILDLKNNVHGLHRNGISVKDASIKLRGLRVAAFKLNTVLAEAKIRMHGITKKHLEYQQLPMWIIKVKGRTYYCHHVNARASWDTRETPENSTKGCIRFKHCDLHIDKLGVATISDHKNR
jgi:hypothetical protein